MTENWSEVSVKTSREQSDALEQWLFDAGALSVTLLDSKDDDELSHAVLEPVPGEVRLWDELILVGLFPSTASPDELHDSLHLSAALLGLQVPVFSLDLLAEQDWERTWMDSFRPMQFGERFWICPTEQIPPDPDAVNLKLDPGLAFGTGTHATTAQCLHWLGCQTHVSLTPLSGRTVLDYGCGSGVLAIAALLLGADSAWAVDIDEQALQATRDNARNNAVAARLQVGQPELVSCVQADVVLANILFKPLMSLADTMALIVRPGGQLVLSGLLEEQMEPLRLRYNECFEFGSCQTQSGWALMTAVRR